MPRGSKRFRISGFKITPKEARIPKASGWVSLRDLTVSRSDFLVAW